ncbi:hypothetical protein [Arcicella rosea]|uniref:Uncharacterized protein n=1 Tax=Arcicella rosea TaxID=502909 RepID=A0A841EWU7_9BACT|nr:hypothetical protein [Arcicella rosea]MBB6005563.1 hypothetical protein [Arcicella rosea]
MANLQDSGNAANIANFENLITYCSNLGATYNPSRDALKFPQLQTLLSEAQTVMAEIMALIAVYDIALENRKKLFSNVRPLTNQVFNTLSISGVDDAVLEGAKSFKRKIHGKRASEKPEPIMVDGVATVPKTNSSSQTSFNYLIEHFGALVAVVANHPEYNPNEEELKVANLTQFINQLKQANTSVINSHVALDLARGKRQQVLYGEKTGLVDIAMDVKTYIKIAFGINSLEYNKIKGISFKRFV